MGRYFKVFASSATHFFWLHSHLSTAEPEISPKIKNNPLQNFPSANDVYKKQVNLILFKKSLLTKRNYLTETLFCKHVFRVFYQNELLDHDFEGWRHFKNRNQTKCSSLNLIHNTISFQHKYNL